MLDLLSRVRFVSVAIVIALMLGAIMMIAIGGYHVYEAAITLAGHGHPAEGVSETLAAKIELLEAVDSFVFAMVMIYFSYGTYFLLVSSKAEDHIGPLPNWLHVKNIGQLKKTLLEVIVVLVAILFLQHIVVPGELAWALMVYPASVAALAVALWLIPFDH